MNLRHALDHLRPPYDWPLLWQYVLALGLVGASLLAHWLLEDRFSGRMTFLLLFSALLPLSQLVRPGPFFVSAVLGFVGVWLVFIPAAARIGSAGSLEGMLLWVFGGALGATALTAWLSRRARESRERDQRNLLDTARRLKLLTDAAPALISYIDARCRYRVTNKGYALWFGSGSFDGMHMREVLGERTYKRIRPHVRTALAGQTASFETEFECRDGTSRFVQAHYVPDIRGDGVVAGFYAMITDISDRKRYEDELRLRSEQFRTLLNAAPLGVYLVDSEFRIQHVNPVAEPVFGATAEELMNRRYNDVVEAMWGRDRAMKIVQMFQHTLDTGEPYHTPEFAERRADRDVTEYYDWRIERIVLPDGGYGVVCYFRDVSKDVYARQAVARSELRYRTLFESIEQGFCILQVIFDESGRPVDYRYIEINPSFERQTGMSDAVGKTIRELVPDIEPFWFDIYGNVALTGEPIRFVDHAKSMGRWFDVDAFRVGDPEERRVAVLFADVTERKKVEEALRESEARFRTMADNAPVLIWLADTSGDATYFNRQWLRFTGRSPEAELGAGWTTGIHPDDREASLRCYRSAFAAHRSFRMEYRLRRHDGEYRWLVDEGVPRHLRNGTFAGYIGSCIDITEHRRSEEVLRETDRRKDEFLATLAHELRNPLAAITTATNVLGSAGDDSTRIGEMAAIIDRQSSQLVRLIDDLLDVTRISRGKVKLERKPVDLADIIRQVVADSLDACRTKGLTLLTDLPEQKLIVHADPVRLSQVISNLLENACKFTPADGEIRVSTERMQNDALVRITDTGIGMSHDQLTRIFEMFEQGQDWPNHRMGGLGIGLSLAKSIMEMHGGEIEAHSSGAGTGSEFLVRLPVSDVETGEAPAGEDSSEEVGMWPASSRRIVVADDNRDSLTAVAAMLRMKGHEVDTAVDGAEALQKVRAVLPDVALLDIGMPGLDGYEVARQIRRETWGTNLLLVAMTGWGQKRDKQRAREAGFDLHLTKPVDMQRLDRVLATKHNATGTKVAT